LKLSYAHDTLKNLYTLWKRPVYIETVLDNQVSILSYNGTKHHIETTDQVVLTN
jgi:stage V sporulation protein R